MLLKNSSLILSAIFVSLLSASSYTAIAEDASQAPENPSAKIEKPGEAGLPQGYKLKAGDSWIKNRQKTTAEEAKDKAQQARMDEMKAALAASKEDRTKGEIKPGETKTETTIKRTTVYAAGESKAAPQAGPKYPPLTSHTYEEVTIKAPTLKVERGPEVVEHATVHLTMPPLKVEKGPEVVEHETVHLTMPPLKVEKGPEVVKKEASAQVATSKTKLTPTQQKELAEKKKQFQAKSRELLKKYEIEEAAKMSAAPAG